MENKYSQLTQAYYFCHHKEALQLEFTVSPLGKFYIYTHISNLHSRIFKNTELLELVKLLHKNS